jgi:glycosyltransferase involved in cell wall biosynthesis
LINSASDYLKSFKRERKGFSPMVFDKPRVGIFEADQPLSADPLNAASMLFGHGYEVDLFLWHTPQNLVTISPADTVHVHNFSDDYPLKGADGADHLRKRLKKYPLIRQSGRALARRAYDMIEVAKRFVAGRDEFYLLPKSVFDSTLSVSKGHCYKCLIGIEKMGLIWAGFIADRMNLPLLYWSMELYTNHHPQYPGVRFEYLRKAERKYHRKSLATVIQDRERAEVLLRENRIGDTELLLVPTSILGEPVGVKADYLHKKFSIPPDKRIALYFGEIKPGRFCLEIAQAAQTFPEEWLVVMHGPVSHSALRYVDTLKRVDVGRKVVFSLDLLPPDRIWEVIASADIGLVFYSSEPPNQYLTGLASEKTGLYLQSGLPIVAFGYPSFKRVIEQGRCGVCISGFHELGRAIDTILSRYYEFRQDAWHCYLESYEFSRQFRKVIERINQL